MKISVILLLAVLLYSPIQAQEEEKFVFENSVSALDYSDVNLQQVKDHPLGREVAIKLTLINDRFTYVVEPTPTTPSSRTEVIKPAIYNSIQKLNRYYKKSVKKGVLEPDVARTEFLKYINYALILYGEDTDNFEHSLGKAKKIEDITALYNQIEWR